MSNGNSLTDHGPVRKDRPTPVLPDPPEVRRAWSAQDLYDMAGWTGLDGEHEGDNVPRLMFSRERGWVLWYLIESEDGEVALTSTEVPCRGCEEHTVLSRVHDAMARYAGGGRDE